MNPLTPHRFAPPKVSLARAQPVPAQAGRAGPSDGGSQTNPAEATLAQLERVVSEFSVSYPSHTSKIPSVRPGEHPLIAFVRSMVASMAAKQEELERLNVEVLEAAEEKERFFANMSHEVRTPMNGIFGMVNLLRELPLDAQCREYIDAIHASSESLLNILDDVLDYAKLNSRQLKLKPRRFELERLLREVLVVYMPNADAKGLELSATICKTLPDCFVADDLRLKQILSNLVANAIKFTDSGSVGVTVQPLAKSGRSQLLFKVSDTGIGIRPEAGKSLFMPFRQVDEESQHFHGTGLGLAISKNLVELMGGRVWFESEVGVGTTFYCTIDYDRPSDDAPAEKSIVVRGRLGAATPRSGEPGEATGKPRVLLVEDNKVNQRVASLSLAKLGCEVTVAWNGQEAVDLAEGPVRFDFICMDIHMPVMDGLKATETIRHLDHPNASVPIYAMTGMAFESDRERCLSAGMSGVIVKPFDLNDLETILREVREHGAGAVALSS